MYVCRGVCVCEGGESGMCWGVCVGGVGVCVCVCVCVFVVVAVVFVVNRYWGNWYRLMNMCMNLAGPVWGKVKEADTIRYI